MSEFFKPHAAFAEGTANDVQKQRAIYNAGARGDLSTLYRYVVLETIFDPTIVDAAKIDYFEHSLQVSNIHLAAALPRNTIIARRVLTPGTSTSTPAMFLFPLFPPTISLPCQPGEHVWVMFENQTGTKNDLGFWMCRITEPGFVEDVNHTHAPRSNDPSFAPTIQDQFEGTISPKYEFRNGRADEREDGRYTIAESATLPGDETAYEQLITETDGSKTTVKEPVPRFKKRASDLVLEGSNNTVIVLGRDRNGQVAKYKIDELSRAQIVDTLPETDVSGPGAGVIDLVAGRGQTDATGGVEVASTTLLGAPTGRLEIGKSQSEVLPTEGDPDMMTDRSRVLIAQKTRVDTNFGLGAFNIELGAGTLQSNQTSDENKKNVSDNLDGDGAIVVKSDKVRLIARSDLEIVVTSHLSRDTKGRLIENPNSDDWAVIAIKANGDIVFRPSKSGLIKLGGDDANKAIVCSDQAITNVDGVVVGGPLITTMGGQFAGSVAGAPNDTGPALASGQAKFSAKVVVK